MARRQQAYPVGLVYFYNCQWSGSENREQRASAHPNAGWDVEHFLSCSSVKRGFLGGVGPMEPGRPLAGASSGTAPPKRVFGYFLHEQQVPRPKALAGPHRAARASPSFGRGAGKRRFQGLFLDPSLFGKGRDFPNVKYFLRKSYKKI